VWALPAETAVAVLMLLTDTGVVWLLVDPLPIRPLLPYPQHLTVPPESNAQVWESAAEIAVAVLMLLTDTGVLWLLVEPLPNFPHRPDPQH
jgi:hypothetical protein